MQYMQDNDPVGAIIAGALVRPAEELVTALRKGSYLRKYGRRGKPKNHYFRLSNDDRELLWDSSNGKVRSISLVSVVKVQQGQTTEVFKRDPLPEYETLSFSLVYGEGKPSKKRTLDVICRNMSEFETWYWGIQLVVAWAQNIAMQQDIAAVATATAAVPAADSESTTTAATASIDSRSDSGHMHMQLVSPRTSDGKLQEFKQIAAALQPVRAMLGSVPPRAPGSVGQPPKREIGDCYIWGSRGDNQALASALSDDCTLQSCCVPMMVDNTHALDIIQVAVGARHAALQTRGGEVYTWGSGRGAMLGNGTHAGTMYPQQVTRLSGKGTVAVSCGHSYTAAVLSDGSLLTWGSGLGGQLGLGPAALTAVWPTRVTAALGGVRVEQVSCGPFHAAAITSEGQLFTWGDGLFGKLGHGDYISCYSPRPVAALADHWVISVSCGWWHSAAAAISRSHAAFRFSSNSVPPSASSSCSSISDASAISSYARATSCGSIPRSTPGFSRSRSWHLAARVAGGPAGGAMFTWGGDFTWQQQGKRDHHEGCLGVGDLSGRSVPTMVKGEDDIKQVACGLNFTVALTSNGEVLQMGRTGAENNKEHNAMWEGAHVPVLVSGLMSTHLADTLACGMSHVAVVATQRTRHSGGARGLVNSAVGSGSVGGGSVMRLLTWGKGSRGQLGLGESRDDHLLPQVVSAVAGRRILYLACGGHYTLAVCEHDPHASRRAQDSSDAHISAPSQSAPSNIANSGPSRAQLGAASSIGTGGFSCSTLGGPGSDRSASVSRGAAPGSGGLVLSTSYNSLASSSAPSSARGEGHTAGGVSSSVGGGSGLSRRSDRGKLETRHSDKGFFCAQITSLPAAQTTAGGLGGLGGLGLQSSRSSSHLTRSVDRVFGSGGGGPGTLSTLATQSVHLTNSEARAVSFAASAAVMHGGGGSSNSSKATDRAAASIAGSSGVGSGPLGPNGSIDHSRLDPSMLSLKALAGASKRSRLALPKSLKGSLKKSAAEAMQRVDSNNSSNSSRQGLGGRGTLGLPTASRSFRQGSYSSRNEPDLNSISQVSAANSIASSLTSSMTPTPSMQSLLMHERRSEEALGGLTASPAPGEGSPDTIKQIRYWQERAANMEQQLYRKTHELEELRHQFGEGSSSQQQRRQPTQQQQHRQVQTQQQQQQLQEWQPQHQQQQATVAAGASESSSNSQLFRGSSLATWMKVKRNSSTGGNSLSGASASGASVGPEQQQQQQQQQQQRLGHHKRGNTEESFKFADLNLEPPTGLEALKQALAGSNMAVGSGNPLAADSSRGTTAVLLATDSNGSNGASQGSAAAAVPPHEQVVLQPDAFQGVKMHSPEASRVLALFQRSQHKRQQREQLENQQLQLQQPTQQQHGTSMQSCAVDADVANSSDGFASINSSPGPSAFSSPVQQQRQQQPQTSVPQELDSTVIAPHSPRSPHIAAAANGACALAPAAAAIQAARAAIEQPDAAAASMAGNSMLTELEQLRQHNRLLQQLLLEMQGLQQKQQQQQQQVHMQQQVLQWQPSQQLAAGQSVGGQTAPVAVVPGRRSGLQGPGMRHRRTVSVDIGSSAVSNLEVAPGVYLSLQALPAGGYELRRVRFAKQQFSSNEAEQWWANHRDSICSTHNISLVQPATVGAGGCSGNRSSCSHRLGSPPLVAALDPFPQGIPAAVTAIRTGSLTELQSHWLSNGDWGTPPGSSNNSPMFSSPASSTYELDPNSQQISVPAVAAAADSALSRLGRPTARTPGAGAVATMAVRDVQALADLANLAQTVYPLGSYSSAASPTASAAAAAATATAESVDGNDGHSSVQQARGLANQLGSLESTGETLAWQQRQRQHQHQHQQGQLDLADVHIDLQQDLPGDFAVPAGRQMQQSPSHSRGSSDPTAAVAGAGEGHKRTGSGLFRLFSRAGGDTSSPQLEKLH